jgi:hypothetical protein
MIQQDYILRMIEQLARVLAKIFFNKEAKYYDEAFVDIDRALSTIVGLDHNLIKGLSSGDIIRLLEFSSDKETAKAKCLITAKLLKENADLKYLVNKEDSEIATEYLKALDLFLESILSGQNKDIKMDGYYQDLREILSMLDDHDIPASIKIRLQKFDELTNKTK